MENSQSESLKPPVNPAGPMLKQAIDKPADATTKSTIDNPVENPSDGNYQRFERPNPVRPLNSLTESDTPQPNPAGPRLTYPTQETVTSGTAPENTTSADTQPNTSESHVLPKTPETTDDKVPAA